jgi:hypothetical protein
MAVPFPETHQRTVPATCATAAGWLRGAFHVPRQQSFADFLTQSGSFLPLTDADLPPHEVLPFFAVQRVGLRFIVPDPADAHVETAGAAGLTSPWSVVCVFAEGVLEGYIDFLTNQRLSDHLRAAQGFILVRQARWEPHDPGDRPPEPAPPWPAVFVQVSELVGIAEAREQQGHGHPGRLAAKVPSEFDSL